MAFMQDLYKRAGIAPQNINSEMLLGGSVPEGGSQISNIIANKIATLPPLGTTAPTLPAPAPLPPIPTTPPAPMVAPPLPTQAAPAPLPMQAPPPMNAMPAPSAPMTGLGGLPSGLPGWMAMLLLNPNFGFGGGGGASGPGASGFSQTPLPNSAQLIAALLGGGASGLGQGSRGTQGGAGAASGASGREGSASVPALGQGGLSDLFAQLNGSFGRFGNTFGGGGGGFPFAPFLRGGGGFGSSNPFNGMGGAGPMAGGMGGGAGGPSLMMGSRLNNPQSMDMRRLLMEQLFGGGGGGGGSLDVN